MMPMIDDEEDEETDWTKRERGGDLFSKNSHGTKSSQVKLSAKAWMFLEIS